MRISERELAEKITNILLENIGCACENVVGVSVQYRLENQKTEVTCLPRNSREGCDFVRETTSIPLTITVKASLNHSESYLDYGKLGIF